MSEVPTALLSRACRIYLERAYPAGPDSLAPALRAYWDIPTEASSDDYLAPNAQRRPLCQLMGGAHPGYRLRLGCAAFPHLKLTIQGVPCGGETCWLFGVDTHDAWHHPDHPDAAAWMQLQADNRELKSRIERAWEAAGLLTQNRLLRQELAATS